MKLQRHALWLLIAILLFSGCSAPEGSEAAARAHLDGEFHKWMSDQESEVATMNYRLHSLQTPIDYEIRRVVADKPDPLAYDTSGDLAEDWDSWPAYRFHVVIEWISKAETPLEKVTTYTLTWNPNEKKWYVSERFL